ncbi:hypothetical protein GCM10022419_065410 [Nonomuraea rosea]|uniref:Uncharacterized protein n=1 Tax=Nonomuraea rosea TaxID=638574 RepID=A0ABP6Y1Y5_9ACTN
MLSSAATPSWTPKPEPVEDIEDRYDDDKDGDGVIKSRDRDDHDPDRGRRSPSRGFGAAPPPRWAEGP